MHPLCTPARGRLAEGEVDPGSHRIRRFLTRSPPPHTPYTCRNAGDKPHPDRYVPGGLRVLHGHVFVKNWFSAPPAGRPARPQLGTAPGTGFARGGWGYLRAALETNVHSQLGDSQPKQNLRIGCPVETKFKNVPKNMISFDSANSSNSFARCRLCYSHDVIAALACSANASVVTARGTSPLHTLKVPVPDLTSNFTMIFCRIATLKLAKVITS